MTSTTNTAILLIDSADRRGLVATISDFLYRHGANILHADQHQDNDLKQNLECAGDWRGDRGVRLWRFSFQSSFTA